MSLGAGLGDRGKDNCLTKKMRMSGLVSNSETAASRAWEFIVPSSRLQGRPSASSMASMRSRQSVHSVKMMTFSVSAVQAAPASRHLINWRAQSRGGNRELLKSSTLHEPLTSLITCDTRVKGFRGLPGGPSPGANVGSSPAA